MPAMSESRVVPEGPSGISVGRLGGLVLVFAVALTSSLAAAQSQSQANGKEIRFDIASNGTINLVNSAGLVTLKTSSGHQVTMTYSLHSSKMEVDRENTPDNRRVEIRAHALSGQQPTTEEAKVDMELSVPAGVAISVSTSTAPITASGLNGDDVTFSSDTGAITVSDMVRSHLHVRSVAGPVNLSNLSLGHVDVTSSGGAVKMANVTGPKVNVATGSGNINYQGNCSGAGDYLMTTHSGDIDMTLPQTASVDLNARSVSGHVENDFPLQAKKHPVFVPKAGSSFAGTSNSGSSSVDLRSFSGRIRVKKQ
jgi:DUF4097 and DUF4098 domain-containing protein YvlB